MHQLVKSFNNTSMSFRRTSAHIIIDIVEIQGLNVLEFKMTSERKSGKHSRQQAVMNM